MPNQYTGRDPVAHFWSRVDKSAGPDGCWLWTGQCEDGYGRVSWGGRRERAHRVAWMLANGPFPARKHVLHRCDNPPCVNPAHLFLGTNADNMADKAAKGREARGEAHGLAKLTAALISGVFASDAAGESKASIARRLGVGRTTIGHVLAKRTWVHVACST